MKKTQITPEGIRSQLSNMKQNETINVNGFSVRKRGSQWIAKKGEHFKRAYTHETIATLVNSLSLVELTKRQTKKVAKKGVKAQKSETKSTKKSSKLAKKLSNKTIVKDTKARKKLGKRNKKLQK